MRTVAIIQAHMGSTRLPGKVLRDIAGSPMLARVLFRTRRARNLDEVVVACADVQQDDVLAAACNDLGASVFRGSDSDVLSRFIGAARQFQAETVVRITSDCPLIDPELIDKVIEEFCASDCDYASNALVRTYPRGLDTEVMSFSALERADAEAHEAYERVHVTPHLYQNSDRFRCVAVQNDRDLSSQRWTVDTPEDIEFVRAVYQRFGGRNDFKWREVLALIEREPDLAELNQRIRQKSLHEG